MREVLMGKPLTFLAALHVRTLTECGSAILFQKDVLTHAIKHIRIAQKDQKWVAIINLVEDEYYNEELEKKRRCREISLINVLIEYPDIDDMLHDWLNMCKFNESPLRGTDLSLEYLNLFKRIYGTTRFCVNKLFEHIRAETGQSWLANMPLHPEDERVASFYTHISVKREHGFQHLGPADIRQKSLIDSQADRAISPQAWRSIRESTEQRKTPSLIYELITTSEAYAHAGLRRVALIEAVVAMEIAIKQFSNSQIGRSRLAQATAADECNTLGSMHKKGGKTKMLEVVLPALLSEDEMPKSVLEDCLKANRKRADLEHGRKTWDVKEEDLSLYLLAIRTFINNLSCLKE
jgi:hypothetical protein